MLARSGSKVLYFCRDGHWVAYATQATGRVQLVADSYPVPRHRTVLTREPIGQPFDLRQFWVAGNKLFYVLEDGRTQREATLSFAGGVIAAGAPHTLFVLPQDCRGVEPAADGTHIFVETPVGPRQAPTLAVIQNWELLGTKQ